MASFVISECGLKPLPHIYARPAAGLVSRNTSKPRFLHRSKKFSDLKTKSSIKFSTGVFGDRNWGLKVSAPLKVASLEEDEEREERIHGVNEFGEQEEEAGFNPGAPPPFKLPDVKAAIPKHCWVKDPWKSISYVVRDVAVVFGLAAAAAYLNNWLVKPLYWAAQGNMFRALFVLGHDCGHGSFSNNPKLNSVVGASLAFFHSCALSWMEN